MKVHPVHARMMLRCILTGGTLIHIVSLYLGTVEPRFNEPLYSEALGITNDIFQPSDSVMYGKEPRYNKPSI